MSLSSWHIRNDLNGVGVSVSRRRSALQFSVLLIAFGVSGLLSPTSNEAFAGSFDSYTVRGDFRFETENGKNQKVEVAYLAKLKKDGLRLTSHPGEINGSFPGGKIDFGKTSGKVAEVGDRFDAKVEEGKLKVHFLRSGNRKKNGKSKLDKSIGHLESGTVRIRTNRGGKKVLRIKSRGELDEAPCDLALKGKVYVNTIDIHEPPLDSGSSDDATWGGITIKIGG